jgi:hypothetical protein
MAGKAKFKKTYGTKLKDQTIDIKQLYSLAGSTGSPRASTMSFGVAGGSSTPPAIDEYARLKTSGDTMIGAISYFPKLLTLDISGEIDLVQGGIGALDDGYTSYLYITGLTNPDDLVTIANPTHVGQLLHIETVPELVLKHNTGNIFIPDGSDRTIIAGGICTLIWDTAVHSAKWTLVSTSNVTGGGTGMQNPAVAQFDMSTFSIEGNWDIGGGQTNFVNVDPTLGIEADLDMNTFDIKDVCRLGFELGGTALPATISGITASADRLHFNVPTGDYHYFTVNDVGRLKIDSGFMEIQDGIDIRNPTTTVPGTAGSGSTEVEYGDIHGWLKIQVDGGNYSIPVWALP